jgi:hypothetical protein
MLCHIQEVSAQCISGASVNHIVSQCTSSSDHDEKITIVGYDPTKYLILSTSLSGNIVAAQGSTNNTSETNTGDNLTLDMLDCGSYSGTVSYVWKLNGSTYTCSNAGIVNTDNVKNQCSYCSTEKCIPGVNLNHTVSQCTSSSDHDEKITIVGYDPSKYLILSTTVQGSIVAAQGSTNNTSETNNGDNLTLDMLNCGSYSGTVSYKWKYNGSTYTCTLGTIYSDDVKTQCSYCPCPAPKGGVVSPSTQTICLGVNKVPQQHMLSGYFGKILRWEYQTPNSTTWNNWGGTSTTAPNNCCFTTAGTWKVRAVVKYANCTTTTSSEANIIVEANSVGGNISPASGSVCWNNNCPATPAFSISGNVGSIVRWEYMRPGEGWTNWGGAGSTTAPGGCFNVSGQWRFRAIAKNGSCGETTSQEAVWNVNPVPVITPYSSVNGSDWAVQQNVVLCQGGSFRLHPHPTTTSGWVGTGPSGFSSTRRDNDFSNAQPNQSGTYTFTHTDANGCSSTTTYNVTVNSVPDLLQYIQVDGGGYQNIDNIRVCEGQTIVLDFCCDQALTFSFRRPDGAVFPGGQNGVSNDQILFGASGVNLGVWQATYSKNGCSRTENFTVSADPPSVGGNISPVSGNVCWNNNCPNTPAFSISGNVGSVVRWEYMRPGEGWTNWGGVGSTTAPGGCFNVSGQWRFRAIVKSGLCNEGASQEAVWNANPVPVITPYSNVNGSAWAVQQNVVLCQGGSFRLHPHPTTTSGWLGTGPSGFSSTRRDNDFSNAQPNQSGVYTFTHTDANGCTSTTTYNVTVNPTPVIIPYSNVNGSDWAIQQNVVLCQGGSFRLHPHPTTSSGWVGTGPAGFSSTRRDNDFSNAQPNQSGVYTFTHTDANGCSSTTTYNVTVNPVPVITPYSNVNGSDWAVEQNVVLCQGGSFRLHPHPTTTSGWLGTGPSGFSSTRRDNDFSNAQPNQSGTYTFTHTDANGCSSTTTYNVTVNSVPVGGNISPASGSVCWNNNCPNTPAFSISGNVGSVARWEYMRPGEGWTNWGGAGSTTAPGGCFNIAGQWRFRAKVKNGICNEVVSQEAVWNANPLSVGGNISPTSGSVCWNNNCPNTPAFSISGNVGSVVRWEYMRPGEGWTNWGAAGSTTAPGGCFNVSGQWRFRVIVKNGSCNEVASQEAVWNANPVPVITPYSNANGSDWAVQQNVVLCQGGSFRLHPHPTTTSGWVGTGPSGFSSTRRDNDFSNAQPNQSGVYTFTHTDANGCSSTTTYNVTVNPVPIIITQPMNQPICQGSAGQFSVVASGATVYQWEWSSDGITVGGNANEAGSTTATLTVSNPNAYYRVKVTNGKGCYVYSNWVKLIFSPSSIGGMVIPTTQTITTTANGVVPIRHTLSGQVGNVVRWEYQTPNSTTWTNWGGTTSTAPNNCCFNIVGTWKVRAIVKSGLCPEVISSEAFVIVTAPPCVVTNVGQYTSGISGQYYSSCIAPYDPPIIQATAATCSSSLPTYQWQQKVTLNGTWQNISGATGQNYDPPVQGATSIWYRRIVNCGTCSGITKGASGAEIFDVHVSNGSISIVPSIGSYCVNSIPSSITLSTTVNGYIWNGTNVTYKWSTGATSPNITIASPTITTTYSVTITEPLGCTRVVSQTIIVNNINNAAINGSLVVCNGYTTTLTAVGGSTYKWNTGATTASITVGAGLYSVTISNNGCSVVKTATVTNDVNVCPRGSIGDYIFKDNNNNGIQDAGDSPLSGVFVQLKNSGGITIATAISSTTGQYIFSNLNAGSYQVCFTIPNGLESTIKSATGSTINNDSDIDAAGKTATINLNIGQNITNVDAGFKAIDNASIGDRVWEDTNGNGIQDANEIGVGGITVNLTGISLAGLTISKSTVTNVNGQYRFDNLTAGAYKVAFVIPNTYIVTKKDAGVNDQIDSDIEIGTNITGVYNLAQGQTLLTVDAGLYRPACIGDFVFEDTDRDGVQDIGELGFANITIILSGTTNVGSPVSLSMLSSSTGFYKFNNLAPGTYCIQITTPLGYIITLANQGTNDTKDSDIDQITGKSQNVSIISGQNYLLLDAGIFNKFSNNCIGDLVAPTFNNVPNNITVQCGQTYNMVTPTASDNCSNSTNIVFTTTETEVAGTCPVKKIITRTWKAVDQNGNVATVSRMITIVDTKAPTITGAPADITIQCGQNIPLPPPYGSNGIQAYDDCDGNITSKITFSEIIYSGVCQSSSGSNGKGKIVCTWVAKDLCGNTTVKQWNITIATSGSSSRMSAVTKTEIIESNNSNIKFFIPEMEERNTNEISVFPNPSDGVFKIDFGEFVAEKLIIFDINGRSIFQKEIIENSKELNIELPNRSSGIYFIYIKSKDKIVTKKIYIMD